MLSIDTKNMTNRLHEENRKRWDAGSAQWARGADSRGLWRRCPAEPELVLSPRAVSYTHLDVYKRQSWDFAPLVDTNLWGGLMLTMLLAVVGIALSFPIGVLLALGRRGNLPVIKYFCVGYILSLIHI